MRKGSLLSCSIFLLLAHFQVQSQSAGKSQAASTQHSPASAHYTGKIIDMHVHIALLPGESTSLSNERTNTLKDILAFMAPSSIVRVGIITMALKGNMTETRLRNDSLITLHQQNPSLIPICSVHPMDGADARAEMERVHNLGVRIIKLHPNTQRFDVGAPEVDSIAAKAAELHMILLFDSYSPWDANEIGKLILLAVSHGDAQFIFAHTGLVNFPQLLTLTALEKYPWFKNNIWMDVSAIAPLLGDSPFRDQLVWTMRRVGIDHFIFGSDFPVFTPIESIKGVHALHLTKEEEKKVFYTNACRLLEIQP